MTPSPSDDDLEPKINADSFKAKGDPTKHDMLEDRTGKHVSEKIYLFPEAYNQLRTELSTFWPNLWTQVQGAMAFDAPRFCYMMDGALDLITQFDSGNVDGICKRYIDELRGKRGLTRLHKPEEYFNNQAMEDSIRLARDVQQHGTLKDIQRLKKEGKL